jgi:hypothetical protein
MRAGKFTCQKIDKNLFSFHSYRADENNNSSPLDSICGAYLKGCFCPIPKTNKVINYVFQSRV